MKKEPWVVNQKRLESVVWLFGGLIQERSAEHSTEVMRIVHSKRKSVLARLEFSGEVDIPLESVVVEPPQSFEGAVAYLDPIDE